MVNPLVLLLVLGQVALDPRPGLDGEPGQPVIPKIPPVNQKQVARIFIPRAVEVTQLNVQVDGKVWILEYKPVAADPDDEATLPVVVQLGRFNIHAMAFARANFDGEVFRNTWTPAHRKSHLSDLLTERIKTVERERALTGVERQKLQLAGTGDIQRYLERVMASRRDFEEARLDYDRGIVFLQGLRPLAQEFVHGPFGDRSLFAKALVKIEKTAHDPAN